MPPATSSSVFQLGAFSVADGRRVLTPSGLPYNTRHKFHYVKDVNTNAYSNGLFGSMTPIQSQQPNAAVAALPSGAPPLGIGKDQAASVSGLPPTSPINPRRISVSPSSPSLGNNSTAAVGQTVVAPLDPSSLLPRRAKTPSLSLSTNSSFLLPPGANSLLPVRPGSAATIVAASQNQDVSTPSRNRPRTSGSTMHELTNSPSSRIRPPSSNLRIASCGLPMGATNTIASSAVPSLSEPSWKNSVRLPHANPQGAAGGGRALSSAATGIRAMNVDLYQEYEEEHARVRNSSINSHFSLAQRNNVAPNEDDVYDALAQKATEHASALLSDLPPIPLASQCDYRPNREQVAAYLESVATWWPHKADQDNNTILLEAAKLRADEGMQTTNPGAHSSGLSPARLSISNRRSLSVVSVATVVSGASEDAAAGGNNLENPQSTAVAVGSPAFASHQNETGGQHSPNQSPQSRQEPPSTKTEPTPYAHLSDKPLSAAPLAVCGIALQTVFSTDAETDAKTVERALAKAGLAREDEGDMFPSPPEGYNSGHATARPADSALNRSPPYQDSFSDTQQTSNTSFKKNGIVEVASLVRSILLLKEVVEGGVAMAEKYDSNQYNVHRPAPTLVNSLLNANILSTSHQRLFGHHVTFAESSTRGNAELLNPSKSNASVSHFQSTSTVNPNWEFSFDNQNASVTNQFGMSETMNNNPNGKGAVCSSPSYVLKTCIDSQHFILQVRIINESGTVIGCHLFEVPLSDHLDTTGEPLSVPTFTAKLAAIVNGALQGAIDDEAYLVAMSEHIKTGKRENFANGYSLPQPLEDPSETAANTRRNHSALCLLTNALATTNAPPSSSSARDEGICLHSNFNEKVATSNRNNEQLIKKLTSSAFAVTVDIHLVPSTTTTTESLPLHNNSKGNETHKTIGPIEGTLATNAGLSLLCQLSVGRDAIEAAIQREPLKPAFDRLACGDEDEEAEESGDLLTSSTPNSTNRQNQTITTIMEATLTSALIRTHAAVVSASSLSRAALVLGAFAQQEHKATMETAAKLWGDAGGVSAGSRIAKMGRDISTTKSSSSFFQLQSDDTRPTANIECLVRSPVPAEGLRTALQQAATNIVAKEAELNAKPNPAGTSVDDALATTLPSTAASKRGGGSSIGTAKRMSIAPRGTLASAGSPTSRGGTASPVRAGGGDLAASNVPGTLNEVSPLLLLSFGQGVLPDAVTLNNVVAHMDASIAVAAPSKRKSVSPTANGGNGKRLSSTDSGMFNNNVTPGGAGPGTIAGVSNNILLAPDGQLLVATITLNVDKYGVQNKIRLQTDAELARRREAQQAANAASSALQLQMESATKGRRGSIGKQASAAGSPTKNGRSPAVSPSAQPLTEPSTTPNMAPLSLPTKPSPAFVFSAEEKESKRYNASTAADAGSLSFWFTRAVTNELQATAIKTSTPWWEVSTIEVTTLQDPLLLPIAVAAVTQENFRQKKLSSASSSEIHSMDLSQLPPPILHWSLRAEDGPAFATAPFPRQADVFSLTCSSMDVFLRSRLVPLGPKSRLTNRATLLQALFATRSVSRSLIAFAGAPLLWNRDESRQFVLADKSEADKISIAATYAPNAHMSLVSALRGFSNNPDTQIVSKPIIKSHPLVTPSEVTFVYLGVCHPLDETLSRQETKLLSRNNPTPSPIEAQEYPKRKQRPTHNNPSKTGTGNPVVLETKEVSIGGFLTHIVEMEPQTHAQATIAMHVGSAAGPKRNQPVRATFIAHPSIGVSRLAAQVQSMANELSAILSTN